VVSRYEMHPTYKLEVLTPKRTYAFSVVLHLHNQVSQYFLDPVSHYEREALVIPEPPHYELQILTPQVDMLRKFSLFAARSQRDPSIICVNNKYPLPTQEKALELFRAWSLGSALQMDGGLDLHTTLYQICKGEHARFVRYMRGVCRVWVMSEPDPNVPQ